MTYLLQICC